MSDADHWSLETWNLGYAVDAANHALNAKLQERDRVLRPLMAEIARLEQEQADLIAQHKASLAADAARAEQNGDAG